MQLIGLTFSQYVRVHWILADNKVCELATVCLPWQHWTKVGHTVNQVYSLEVLKRFREKVTRKRPELFANNSRILHHDNAPAHTALSVREFLATKQITLLEHPPYSPGLAPVTFFCSRRKEILKGKHFDDTDDIRSNTTEALKVIPQNHFQNCFEGWTRRWHRCIASQRNTLKATTVVFSNEFANFIVVQVCRYNVTGSWLASRVGGPIRVCLAETPTLTDSHEVLTLHQCFILCVVSQICVAKPLGVRHGVVICRMILQYVCIFSLDQIINISHS